MKEIISIIIPAYNEEKNLSRLVNSIKKQTDKNTEIIIVNNNSIDNTLKIAKKLADRVYNCKEQGISPARNYGAKKARGEILVFLDADSIVAKEWLIEIRNSFEDNSLTAVSGMDLYDHPEKSKRLLVNTYSRLIFYSILISNYFGKWVVTGNNFAIKKDIFLKTGGFEKLIVEDYYLSLKLRELPKIKCTSNRKMKVTLSSRRFEKEGILKMFWFWFKSILIKIPSEKYKSHDKL